LGCAVLLAAAMMVPAKDRLLHTFKKIQMTDQFYCEGIHYGDFNRDNKMDVVSGPFWYAGPDFQEKREYRPAQAYNPKLYSDNFITFAYDFNQDQWCDILIIDIPGKEAFWYVNPQGKAGPWAKHLAFPVVDNESPNFGDLTGDGKPELIFNTGGFLGYATPDWRRPTEPWKFHPISPKGAWHKYSHGLGFGDINGDGRADFVEIGGWWEQPASLENDPVWRLHPANLGEGAAQMLIYDVNGDGLNDIITCLNPHKYGLAWFEQVKQGGEITFRKHLIMGDKPEDNKYGVKFTQIHAFDLVDIDGDGLKDFVTGKRFWAHPPPTDPESDAPAVLYWFKLERSQDGRQVEFIPHLIDDNSGVGTQVTAADLNGDGLPDVVVGNKKGTFVFLHQTKVVSQTEWENAQPKPYKPLGAK
jgi:hypothetical protein